MGDDTQIQVEGKGSIKLKHGIFKDVLYVPSLTANLLSVYQMTHTSPPKQVLFGPNSMEVSDISTGNNSQTFCHTEIQYYIDYCLKGEVKPLCLFLLHMTMFPLELQIHNPKHMT